LVTLHRPPLVDGPLLPEVLARLGEIARTLPVLFPVHPRTRKMIQGIGVARGVLLVDPVGYLDFLSLESDAAAVLTDSGGVRGEAATVVDGLRSLRGLAPRWGEPRTPPVEAGAWVEASAACFGDRDPLRHVVVGSSERQGAVAPVDVRRSGRLERAELLRGS